MLFHGFPSLKKRGEGRFANHNPQRFIIISHIFSELPGIILHVFILQRHIFKIPLPPPFSKGDNISVAYTSSVAYTNLLSTHKPERSSLSMRPSEMSD
jgi:hypothetical protein